MCDEFVRFYRDISHLCREKSKSLFIFVCWQLNNCIGMCKKELSKFYMKKIIVRTILIPSRELLFLHIVLTFTVGAENFPPDNIK